MPPLSSASECSSSGFLAGADPALTRAMALVVAQLVQEYLRNFWPSTAAQEAFHLESRPTLVSVSLASRAAAPSFSIAGSRHRWLRRPSDRRPGSASCALPRDSLAPPTGHSRPPSDCRLPEPGPSAPRRRPWDKAQAAEARCRWHLPWKPSLPPAPHGRAALRQR
jgi:hypothetical protein